MLLLIPTIVKIWMVLFILIIALVIGHAKRYRKPIEYNPMISDKWDDNSYQ